MTMQKKKKKLSERELLEMAREMDPDTDNDFINKKERQLLEFMRGIKII